MKFNLNSFYNYVKQGKLSCCEKQIGKNTLVSFKYTNEIIYKQDWDEITLNARGITFEKETGEIVSFSFKKFFNFQELYNTNTKECTELYKKIKKYQGYNNLDYPLNKQHFHCLEKIDGSCGQVFYYNGKWIVKTLGSFDSEQAIWAQKWFDENISTLFLIQNRTYLFEIIYDEDIHPIHYDFEGMVLLSVISNVTGEEYPLSEIEKTAELLKCRMAKIYDFSDFNEAVAWAKKLPKNQEGLVITFDNGFKCKAKSDDWCQLAKMFEGMTKWNIWVCYDVERDFFHAHVDKHNGYKPIDDEVLFIPEELGDIRKYAETVRSEVERLTEYSIVLAKKAQQMTCERRLQYEWVNTNHPTLMPAIMKSLDYLNGKTQYVRIRQVCHKLIKPQSDE